MLDQPIFTLGGFDTSLAWSPGRVASGNIADRSAAWPASERGGCYGQLRRDELCETGVPRESALRVVRERRRGSGSNVEFISFGEVDADAARLFLKNTPVSTVIRDGYHRVIPPRNALQTTLMNLRPSLHWRADHPLDLLSFIVPSIALDRWTEEAGMKPIRTLFYPPEEYGTDEIITGFGLAILPWLDRVELAPRLFVDQVLHSVCGYLAREFGAGQQRAEPKGGLALWQERRAKELIVQNRNNQLSLRGLAAECGLSISHFTRAFKITFGQSPYQWMIERRIEQARTLLITSKLTLSEIAIACGFADQSHFTRIFAKHAARSPGAWRRANAEFDKA